MKTLTLLRHAKSGWDDPSLRDFDRALNAKGKRAAARVGRHWRELGLAFDTVVASPAVRVVETLEQVAIGYGDDLAPAWDRRLYLASAVTLLDVVRELPDSVGSALFVGHNPGLEDLVLMLVSDTARLTFDVTHWADVAANGATFDLFVRPRDLDPALGPEAG